MKRSENNHIQSWIKSGSIYKPPQKIDSYSGSASALLLDLNRTLKVYVNYAGKEIICICWPGKWKESLIRIMLIDALKQYIGDKGSALIALIEKSYDQSLIYTIKNIIEDAFSEDIFLSKCLQESVLVFNIDDQHNVSVYIDTFNFSAILVNGRCDAEEGHGDNSLGKLCIPFFSLNLCMRISFEDDCFKNPTFFSDGTALPYLFIQDKIFQQGQTDITREQFADGIKHDIRGEQKAAKHLGKSIKGKNAKKVIGGSLAAGTVTGSAVAAGALVVVAPPLALLAGAAALVFFAGTGGVFYGTKRLMEYSRTKAPLATLTHLPLNEFTLKYNPDKMREAVDNSVKNDIAIIGELLSLVEDEESATPPDVLTSTAEQESSNPTRISNPAAIANNGHTFFSNADNRGGKNVDPKGKEELDPLDGFVEEKPVEGALKTARVFTS